MPALRPYAEKDWTHFLQRHTEETAYARKQIGRHSLTSKKPVIAAVAGGLPDYGPAPNFVGIDLRNQKSPACTCHVHAGLIRC